MTNDDERLANKKKEKEKKKKKQQQLLLQQLALQQAVGDRTLKILKSKDSSPEMQLSAIRDLLAVYGGGDYLESSWRWRQDFGKKL